MRRKGRPWARLSATLASRAKAPDARSISVYRISGYCGFRTDRGMNMSTATARSAAPRQLATGIQELKRKVNGQVVLPQDDAYDAARKIWNAMIDKRPPLIVRCAPRRDVVNAVDFARDNGLPLAIRGGGHNIAGNALCDGGIVVDLSQMKAAKVDPGLRPRTIGV